MALFLTLCWLQAARGQVAASIEGIVADSSGAPVASATVTAKNIETGAVRMAITDGAGRYQIVSLAIGPY
jgi:protocatechuate 3,4-dioxygenase beta subunit